MDQAKKEKESKVRYDLFFSMFCLFVLDCISRKTKNEKENDER